MCGWLNTRSGDDADWARGTANQTKAAIRLAPPSDITTGLASERFSVVFDSSPTHRSFSFS